MAIRIRISLARVDLHANRKF